MQTDQILNEQEMLYFKRGRNAKSYTKAKNTNVVSYRISTGGGDVWLPVLVKARRALNGINELDL